VEGETKKSCRHFGSQEEVLLYGKCSGCALERGRKIVDKKREEALARVGERL
jgi:hypothetical protein